MKLNDFLVVDPAQQSKKVVVPMANDPDVICCIAKAMEMGIADFILIGDEAKIKAVAAESGVDVSAAEFVAESDEIAACQAAARFVSEGRAQIMMKGLVSTSNFSRAFLNKEYALVPEGRLISHVALFEIPTYHKPLIVTDAALNIAPDVDAKAKIILNTVEFAQKIGIERPKVACIAAVEKVNPKIQSTVEANELKQMGANGDFGNCIVDGPLALDVAVSKKCADTKGLKSEVAGDPDILIMPALDAANVLYKTLTQLCNASLASVITGVKAPIVLTSRADSEQTKLLSLALAAKIC